jgi:uncharacterized protein YjdB
MRRIVLLFFSLAALLSGCFSGSNPTPSNGTPTPSVTVQMVSISPTALSLSVGQSQQIHATATYSDGSSADITSSATWSSDTPSVATVGTGSVSNPGVITGIGAGTANLTATDAGSGNKATVLVTVTNSGNTLQSISITPAVTQIAIHTKMQLTATGTFTSGPANITPQVNWTSSNTGAVTVDQSGVVTAVATGTAQITATDPTTQIQSFITLTTTGATLSSIAITPQDPSIVAGTTLQMTASGTFSDGTVQDLTPFVNWTIGNSAVATVSPVGLVTAVSSGNVPLTALDAQTQIQGQTTVTVP